MAGPVTFTDTYGAARPGGRTHKGVDMFAAAGTPVVAPADGRLTHFEDGLGGMSFGLVADDGTFHYGTHLSAYENVGIGRVTAGTLVGRVGSSGNAVGTPPHLHWQIHPGGRGKPTIDPTPTAHAVCTAPVSPTPVPVPVPVAVPPTTVPVPPTVPPEAPPPVPTSLPVPATVPDGLPAGAPGADGE